MSHATRAAAASVILLLIITGRAGAQGTLRVAANEVDFVFADYISFTLDAEADVPVNDVVLRFNIGSDSPRNRRIPEFTPGNRVVAHHRDTLARGQIPPAAVITWWWTLTDASGATMETEPRSTTYLDSRFDWQVTDGTNVRVYWYGDNRPVGEEFAAGAEEVFDRLATIVGSRPDRTIKIVTYQSDGDMRSALVDKGEVYEDRLATLGARVAPDILVLLSGRANDQRDEILAHELSHIVLHLHFARQYVDAPLWLDEGLAMYAEGPLDADERSTLEQAIRDDSLMSVRSLTSFPGQADLVPLAYAESRDIVDYLITTHGQASFQQLVDAVGSGEMAIDAALTAVYGYDQLSLYQAYRAARGMSPAVTPGPDEVVTAPRRAAAEQSRAGGICGSVALLLPAIGVFWRRERRERRERRV